jgi:hypothetical protein
MQLQNQGNAKQFPQRTGNGTMDSARAATQPQVAFEIVAGACGEGALTIGLEEAMELSNEFASLCMFKNLECVAITQPSL